MMMERHDGGYMVQCSALLWKSKKKIPKEASGGHAEVAVAWLIWYSRSPW